MIVIRSSGGEPPPDGPQSHIANLSGAVARLRSRDEAATSDAPEVDHNNVVPFVRGRREPAAVPAIPVSPADRVMGALATSRWRLAAFVICSAAVHAALYLPFIREPEPMASIGEIAITAEIVLGASTPAGVAARAGDAEASPTPAQEPEPKPKPEPEPEVATAEPQPPEPQPTETQQPEAQQVAELPKQEEQPAVKPQAPVEPAPEVQEAPAEIQAVPQEAPTAELQTAARPEMATESKPAPPAVKPAPPVAKPSPKKPEETRKPAAKPEPKREERRVASRGERNDSRSTAPESRAASGFGRGRSDLNTNYRGLVAAHLARFKQFPTDARSRGDSGSATVAFSLSGGGGVTSVRLVRATGVGSLDQEATAMVRRASPFPAPPDGRSVSFTVPVSFRIR